MASRSSSVPAVRGYTARPSRLSVSARRTRSGVGCCGSPIERRIAGTGGGATPFSSTRNRSNGYGWRRARSGFTAGSPSGTCYRTSPHGLRTSSAEQFALLRSHHNGHEGHKGFENEAIVSLVSFVVNAFGNTERLTCWLCLLSEFFEGVEHKHEPARCCCGPMAWSAIAANRSPSGW